MRGITEPHAVSSLREVARRASLLHLAAVDAFAGARSVPPPRVTRDRRGAAELLGGGRSRAGGKTGAPARRRAHAPSLLRKSGTGAFPEDATISRGLLLGVSYSSVGLYSGGAALPA